MGEQYEKTYNLGSASAPSLGNPWTDVEIMNSISLLWQDWIWIGDP